MPALVRSPAVGGLPRSYAREFYSHQDNLVSATIPAIEWTPPGGAVTVVGPHDTGLVYAQFAIQAGGCPKVAFVRFYRDNLLLQNWSVGQCGDGTAGNICSMLYHIPPNSGGRYEIRFIETNCGTRDYSSAYRHIWIPSKYPPPNRLIRQVNPVQTVNYSGYPG